MPTAPLPAPTVAPAARRIEEISPATANGHSSASATATSPRKISRVALVLGVAGVLALSAVGYSAWQKKRAEKAEAEQRAATEAAGRRAQARPEKKAAADPRFAGVNPDAPAVPEPVPSAPAPVPPEFSAPAPVVSTPPARTPAAPSAPTPVAKSVVPAPVPPPEFVAPSEAFKSWVTGLKINGVRPGAVPRVSIAGASFNQGDTINSELGVTFDGYDAERRMLRFKERSGALLERRDR